jgi:hypothetical protein
MTRIIAAVVAAMGLFAYSAVADDAAPAGSKKTYLLTTTHTPEQCLAALDEMASKDKELLAKMDWGCMSGDHTGYAIVTASDEKTAIGMLPPANRVTAKAEMVTKFTPEQIQAIHKKMGK